MLALDFGTGAERTCAQIAATESTPTAAEMKLRFLTIVVGALSIAATMFVATLLHNNKSLMSHPNQLIYYMCLAEAICAWQAIIAHIGVGEIICYFELDELFVWSTFNQKTSAEAVAILEKSNFNILCLAEFFSLSLNFFLCLDIILTLRNPFYPHERRMKGYLVGSVVFAGIAYFFTLGRHNEEGFSKNVSTKTQAIGSTLIMSLYILFSISSVSYAWRINTRPGMSTDVRQSFITRHRNYVMAYLLTWLPYFGFSFFVLFISSCISADIKYSEIANSEQFGKQLLNWLAAWNYACMCTGLAMSVVRIREPAFWAHVKAGVY